MGNTVGCVGSAESLDCGSTICVTVESFAKLEVPAVLPVESSIGLIPVELPKLWVPAESPRGVSAESPLRVPDKGRVPAESIFDSVPAESGGS